MEGGGEVNSFEKFLKDKSAELDAVMLGKSPPKPAKPLYNQEYTTECQGHGDYVEFEINRLDNMARAIGRKGFKSEPELIKMAKRQLAFEVNQLIWAADIIDPETHASLTEIVAKLRKQI